jgi:dipeptide/tripeptide permease
VSAFGGDQFGPTQARALETYFFLFYFSINLGSVLAQLLTPILRSDVAWSAPLYKHGTSVNKSRNRDIDIER